MGKGSRKTESAQHIDSRFMNKKAKINKNKL